MVEILISEAKLKIKDKDRVDCISSIEKNLKEKINLSKMLEKKLGLLTIRIECVKVHKSENVHWEVLAAFIHSLLKGVMFPLINNTSE